MDITMNVTDSPADEPPRSATPATSSASHSSDRSGVLPPKRLFRDPSGPIGGVAGGLAGYFAIDPVITRLAWVVALFSGVGFPAYVVCWLVIPKAKTWPPPAYAGLAVGARDPHQTALISGLVILALVAIVGQGFDGLGQYLLPAALVGMGVYLLSQRGVRSELGVAAASPAADFSTSEADLTAWRGPSEGPRAGSNGLVTPTVLSLLAIGVGVLAALHAAGLVHVSMAAVAAGALVLVGGGLLLSLWLGRARGLVPLGLGCVCVMLAASAAESWRNRSWSSQADGQSMSVDLDDVHDAPMDGTGKVSHVPRTLDELEPQYQLGAGELTLDLTALDFREVSREVDVDVGIGTLLVLVREDAPVDVHVDVGIGDADALGSTRKGLGASADRHVVPDGATGQLTLRLNVGVGKAEVRRGS